MLVCQLHGVRRITTHFRQYGEFRKKVWGASLIFFTSSSSNFFNKTDLRQFLFKARLREQSDRKTSKSTSDAMFTDRLIVVAMNTSLTLCIIQNLTEQITGAKSWRPPVADWPTSGGQSGANCATQRGATHHEGGAVNVGSRRVRTEWPSLGYHNESFFLILFPESFYHKGKARCSFAR